MLFDAHERAFRYFGGVARRGIYDDMKTAVDLVFTGRERRFLQMASHYLVEPVACTPTAGWEKGRVENQVGNVREWLFTPKPRFKTLADLNIWLERRCREIGMERAHPEQPQSSCWEVFDAAERQILMPLAAPFDGFAERDCRVNSSALVNIDRNRYSVECSVAGKVAAVRGYANRIVVVAEGCVVAEHAREFGRDKVVYNPWHYVPALARKPGALRNGAPFRDWDLPAPLAQVRSRLSKVPGGDRQFVEILAAGATDGLEKVTVACELALEAGAISSDYVLNAISRLKAPPRSRRPSPPASSATAARGRCWPNSSLPRPPSARCARSATRWPPPNSRSPRTWPASTPRAPRSTSSSCGTFTKGTSWRRPAMGPSRAAPAPARATSLPRSA
jgi:hypothetical protein